MFSVNHIIMANVIHLPFIGDNTHAPRVKYNFTLEIWCVKFITVEPILSIYETITLLVINYTKKKNRTQKTYSTHR